MKKCVKISEKQLIEYFIDKHWPVPKIAIKLGCSDTRIWNHLRKFGITRKRKNTRVIDLSNKVYNDWLVIERDYSRTGDTYWICKCIVCNNKYSVPTFNLIKNKSKRCKKCSYIQNDYYDLKNHYWISIIRSANKRNIEFKLDKKYIYDLWLNQCGKCAISGLEISEPKRNGTASLDRIDSKKGYIEGNVWWVHKDINQLKWTFDYDKLIELCSVILEYHKLKENREIPLAS